MRPNWSANDTYYLYHKGQIHRISKQYGHHRGTAVISFEEITYSFIFPYMSVYFILKENSKFNIHKLANTHPDVKKMQGGDIYVEAIDISNSTVSESKWA